MFALSSFRSSACLVSRAYQSASTHNCGFLSPQMKGQFPELQPQTSSKFHASTRIRAFTTKSSQLQKPPEYYFVDTNIISYCAAVTDPDIPSETVLIKKFFNAPHRKSYFTETVKKELEAINRQGEKIVVPQHFQYVESGLSDPMKNFVLQRIKHAWNVAFAQVPKKKRSSSAENKNLFLRFTDVQERSLRNDFFILFEACFSCFKPEIAPDHDFTPPIFVTNNLHLCRKFLRTERERELIESFINVYGFEHLIQVKTPYEVFMEADASNL